MQSEYHEEELIQAAQKGDRGAFARLYEVHMGRVYRYLLGRLGESADAEDVTAEVFVRVMRADRCPTLTSVIGSGSATLTLASPNKSSCVVNLLTSFLSDFGYSYSFGLAELLLLKEIEL